MGRPLILHHASHHPASGHWSDHDYDVTSGGKTVGRIYWADTGVPEGQQWFWSIIFHHRRPGPAAHQGYAEDRAAAMAAFRKAWDAMS